MVSIAAVHGNDSPADLTDFHRETVIDGLLKEDYPGVNGADRENFLLTFRVGGGVDSSESLWPTTIVGMEDFLVTSKTKGRVLYKELLRAQMVVGVKAVS